MVQFLRHPGNCINLIRCPLIVLICLFVVVFSLLSCTDDRKKITLRVTSDCWNFSWVDSTIDALLADDYEDFGARKLPDSYHAFDAERVLRKGLRPAHDGCIYIPDVQRTSYALLYLQGKVGKEAFFAIKREIDFSDVAGDTVDVHVCFDPGLKRLSN
jgi:hypothetical protein